MVNYTTMKIAIAFFVFAFFLNTWFLAWISLIIFIVSLCQNNNSKENYKYSCTDCEAKVSKEDEFCPECGAKFEEDEIKCSKCKTLNPKKNKFCLKC